MKKSRNCALYEVEIKDVSSKEYQISKWNKETKVREKTEEIGTFQIGAIALGGGVLNFISFGNNLEPGIYNLEGELYINKWSKLVNGIPKDNYQTQLKIMKAMLLRDVNTISPTDMENQDLEEL